MLEEDIRDMSLLALATLLGSRVTGVGTLMFVALSLPKAMEDTSQVKSSQVKSVKRICNARNRDEKECYR